MLYFADRRDHAIPFFLDVNILAITFPYHESVSSHLFILTWSLLHNGANKYIYFAEFMTFKSKEQNGVLKIEYSKSRIRIKTNKQPTKQQ